MTALMWEYASMRSGRRTRGTAVLCLACKSQCGRCGGRQLSHVPSSVQFAEARWSGVDSHHDDTPLHLPRRHISRAVQRPCEPATMASRRANFTGFDKHKFAAASGQPANDPWARRYVPLSGEHAMMRRTLTSS